MDKRGRCAISGGFVTQIAANTQPKTITNEITAKSTSGRKK